MCWNKPFRFDLESWQYDKHYPGIHQCMISTWSRWPNGIIFHQPRFPWNKMISPFLSFWGEVVWGRYNLTRSLNSQPSFWGLTKVRQKSYHLVGGFNPFEKISLNGNLPQIGVKIKNNWNHHPVIASFWTKTPLEGLLYTQQWAHPLENATRCPLSVHILGRFFNWCIPESSTGKK